MEKKPGALSTVLLIPTIRPVLFFDNVAQQPAHFSVVLNALSIIRDNSNGACSSVATTAPPDGVHPYSVAQFDALPSLRGVVGSSSSADSSEAFCANGLGANKVARISAHANFGLDSSQSNTVRCGPDVCLPNLSESVPENPPFPTADQPSTSSVGFFDNHSNHSRLNVLDIDFALNSPKKSSASKKTFECSICSREFSRHNSLLVHRRVHSGHKPYQCKICGRTFSQMCNVKRHVESHKVFPHLASKIPSAVSVGNSTQPVVLSAEKCSVCEHVSSNGWSKASNYSCQYCMKSFACHKCSRRHLSRSHRDKKLFQCYIRSCRKLIETLDEYLSHVATHEDEIRYICPVCRVEFRTLYEIGVHQSSHVFKSDCNRRAFAKRVYRCFRCGDLFKSVTTYDRHQSTASHHHQCRHCPKVYDHGRQLRRHVNACHSKSDKFICQQCPGRFSFGYTYKIHAKKHAQAGVSGAVDKTGLKCSDCCKTFSRRDSYLRHATSTHAVGAESKKFACTFEGCVKTFQRLDRLKAHLLTHNNANKKFKCDSCSKSFIRKQALSLHVAAVHLKKYRFSCDVCRKGFNRADVFRNHCEKCKSV